MAEQGTKKKRSAKQLGKDLKVGLAAFGELPKPQWCIQQKVAGTTTTHNCLSEEYWESYKFNFCLVDSNLVTKQYSTKYNRLTQIHASWVGFYPSTYEVEQVVDEAGNTNKVTITDTDELNKIPTLKGGNKFYFANLKYTVVQTQLKRGGAGGYLLLGESAKEKEGIFIRKTGDAWFIYNFALTGHPDRQVWGSARAMMGVFMSHVKSTYLDEDDPYSMEAEQDVGDW